MRDPTRQTLLRTALFDIDSVSGVAECRLVNRPDIAPEEGARCAQQMNEFLITNVLVAGTNYAGFLLDVRRGPAVFGPRTRDSLSRLFQRGNTHEVPIVVLVGDHAIQRLQFASICREAAPNVAQVVGTADEAWTLLLQADERPSS